MKQYLLKTKIMRNYDSNQFRVLVYCLLNLTVLHLGGQILRQLVDQVLATTANVAPSQRRP